MEGTKFRKNIWRGVDAERNIIAEDEIQTLGLVSRPRQQKEGGEEQTLFSFLQKLDSDSNLSPPL